MDDVTFQRWSETLMDLRQKRQSAVDQNIQEKAESFAPVDFFDLAMSSLEEIMDRWFVFEQAAWEAQPPDDPSQALEMTRGEMESIVDFELEAIQRDRGSIQSRITWNPNAIAQAEPNYQTFVDELRKKYQVKIRGLSGSQPKRKLVGPASQAVHASYSGHSSGSGVGLFLMFVVGLLLGGGPSIYFMDASKKLEKKYQEERGKMLADQRTLADSMALLHDRYEQLATGKLKNIPQLEQEIQKIRTATAQKKQEIEKEHLREREKKLKKIPAGNRLDQALEDLEKERDQKLADLKARDTAATELLLKQQTMLKDLIAR